MSWIYPPRFDMNVQRSKSIGDCYSKNSYCDCVTPDPEDGSPYEVYERNGELRKSLPLNYRPTYGKAFPGAQGHFVPITKSYANYRPSCEQGMLLLDGRGPCVSEDDCKKMRGQMCKYPSNYTNKDSCFVNQCGSEINFRCPEGIRKPI